MPEVGLTLSSFSVLELFLSVIYAMAISLVFEHNRLYALGQDAMLYVTLFWKRGNFMQKFNFLDIIASKLSKTFSASK